MVLDRVGCPESTVCDHSLRDESEGEEYQERNDNEIIQLPQHRNEIGNDVERHQKIRHRKTEEPFGNSRSTLIPEKKLVNANLAFQSRKLHLCPRSKIAHSMT